MNFNNVISIIIGDKQVKNIMFSDGNIVWESKEIENDDKEVTPLYIENVGDSDGEFQLTKDGSPTYKPNLIYRIGDNGEWFEYDIASLPSITVPSKSKIYFKGDNTTGFNTYYEGGYQFTFSNPFNIGGYITSLISTTDFNTITVIPSYSFRKLFSYQSNLLDAKDLITDNIINVGYEGFYYCFSNCRALNTAPTFENLTSVSSYAFKQCFLNCSSLKTPPNFNNLTSIGSYVFEQCFYFCTSLKVIYAPNITTWDESDFFNWVYGITSTGIMYKPKGIYIPTDSASGVPTNWTTVDY